MRDKIFIAVIAFLIGYLSGLFVGDWVHACDEYHIDAKTWRLTCVGEDPPNGYVFKLARDSSYPTERVKKALKMASELVDFVMIPNGNLDEVLDRRNFIEEVYQEIITYEEE